MEKVAFWDHWLLVVGLLVAAFGMLMALFNGTNLFDFFNDQIDPVFWGRGERPDGSVAFQRWAYGAWGATVSGWGVFIVFIARFPYRRREIWARNCLLAGLALWYVLDTGISLYYRVYFNALFNTLLLILAGLPLGLTWKSFQGRPSSWMGTAVKFICLSGRTTALSLKCG